MEPRWAPGDKDGVGTAYSASSRVGLTVRSGILTSLRMDWEDAMSRPTALGVELVDIPVPATQRAPIRFTFLWTESGRWEGGDHVVEVV
jgi:hypothetical protein